MTKRIYIILFFSALFCFIGKAQYFPLFSQYISNGLILNPAYAASREVLSVNFLYRDQWVGFSGAPEYETFTAHAPLKNIHIGLGLSVMNEQSVDKRNTQIYFNYSYRINVGKSKLAFGLKAGVNYEGYNWDKVYLNNYNDPVFKNSSLSSYTLPNFGVGAYYYSNKMFMGIISSHEHFIAIIISSNAKIWQCVRTEATIFKNRIYYNCLNIPCPNYNLRNLHLLLNRMPTCFFQHLSGKNS